MTLLSISYYRVKIIVITQYWLLLRKKQQKLSPNETHEKKIHFGPFLWLC